ncbi:MAG: 23S rRNA (adenine(2030)-N(6))-methyltransferase RlmJ [Spirochaetaceae bacterium]|jgi:23S rRNA (adenine2030-N6)-methyltransferase|nr:23S rRNA (adenine(2030)-N(6))-methyltransferase RlmJ [Spirochaetaceae bacterium]
MLSYRHAFHAGNAVDVFKHTVLAFCLDYLAKKETAFTYIDTHAGAGLYNLEESRAAQNREWESGISLVLEKFPPAAAGSLAAPYLACVKALPKAAAPCYEGSPLIALRLLRKQDKAHCFELHPADYSALCRALDNDKRFTVRRENGLAALKSLLPPPQKRSLVFIDPSYEVKDDYQTLPRVLDECLDRFPGGMYMLWFPLLKQDSPGAAASQNFIQSLPRSGRKSCTVSVMREREQQGRGLYGSGLFIINPPWTLRTALEESLPALVSLLGGAGHSVSWEAL